jgi:hypothetical protein
VPVVPFLRDDPVAFAFRSGRDRQGPSDTTTTSADTSTAEASTATLVDSTVAMSVAITPPDHWLFAWATSARRTAARPRAGEITARTVAAKPAGKARRNWRSPRCSCTRTAPGLRSSTWAISAGLSPWRTLKITTCRYGSGRSSSASVSALDSSLSLAWSSGPGSSGGKSRSKSNSRPRRRRIMRASLARMPASHGSSRRDAS